MMVQTDSFGKVYIASESGLLKIEISEELDIGNKETKTKIYKGYVRNLEKGVDTTLNPAGDLLWKKGKFIGNKPFIKNGFRYVRSKDYFDLFESLYLVKNCDPYYYTIKL